MRRGRVRTPERASPATTTIVAAALEAAAGAARARGLRLVELEDLAAHHEAAALFRRIWRTDASEQLLQPGLIRALAHAGNYVAGAYLGKTLVAAGVGFFAADGHLHSHITGVSPEHQDRGAGYCLKLHQRAWSLERGVPAVRWTFDPLVRRNAYFNIHKLGARPTEYLTDFYGPMADGINAGDESDRLYVTWDLAGHRAVAAAEGRTPDSDVATLRAKGAVLLVDRSGDEPVVDDAGPADVALVAVPEEIDALRAASPDVAMRWRLAVRSALESALRSGMHIVDMSREGWYVLHGTPAAP